MSTLSVGTIQSNTTSPPTINNSAGTQIGTFCRAWVNFNGTSTVAIRASFNVTSITDNGLTGDYTVNFTTAMVDSSYVVVGAAGRPDTTRAQFAYGQDAAGQPTGTPEGASKLAGSCRIITGVNQSAVDFASVSVAIFR